MLPQLAIEPRPSSCRLQLAHFDLQLLRPCMALPGPTLGDWLFLLGMAPRSFGPFGIEPPGPS